MARYAVISDYHERSHNFFVNQKILDNNVNRFLQNNKMNQMLRLALDYLSAISSLHSLTNNKLELKIFWEAVKSVSEANIDLIRDSNNLGDHLDNSINPIVCELIKTNFPNTSNINEEKNNWYPLQWATINYDKFTPKEYKQFMEDNISSIVKDCKSDLKVVTVAHLLATNRLKSIPLDVITTIFNRFPTIASTEDRFGRFPLHYAAEYCKDGNFLQYIIQQNPKALETFTKFCELPIDISSQLPNNMEIFRILLLASSKKFMLIDSHGSSLVHRLTENAACEVEYLQLLVESFPEVVTIPNRNGCYPLHLAARNGSIEKVCLLLNSCSEGVEMSGFGWFPLHYAIIAGNLDVVKLLLDANPDVLEMSDRQGCLPLTYAIIAGNLDVVKLLIDANPKGVKHVVADGQSILHIACQLGGLVIIQYICQTFPHLGKVKDDGGKLPLHTLFNSEFIGYDTIKVLYDINPDAAKVKNNNNYLPINCLNFNEMYLPSIEEFHVIELLCSDYPESIDIIRESDEDDEDDEITSLYDQWSPLSNDFHRCLSRIGRLNHNQEFRDLNFQARRMAMFLAFRGVSSDPDLNIWRKLKIQNNMELLRYTIAFL